MAISLKSPLTELIGVGDGLAASFQKLGVSTVGQLIDYYPRAYEDYSCLTPINQLKPGPVTIKAVIKQAKGRYVRRGLHITEAVASDDSGSVRLIWFNQPYRAAGLKAQAEYYISGLFELSHQRLAIMNPSAELVSDFPVNTARILSIYRETKGLSSHQIRKVLREIFLLKPTLKETLPNWLIKSAKLMPRSEAIKAIHFPDSSEQLANARRRLGFEEVFALSLASLLNKQENLSEVGLTIPFEVKLAQTFVKHLPFKLTDAQRRAIWQIYKDLGGSQPMNRLVEGDVGSGKTVVAAMAALMVLKQGHQVAFMAPTELLARQHAETLHELLKPLAMEKELDLIVGGMTPAQKTKARSAIAKGQAKLIVGTHTLIQEQLDMKNLALVIIDEQQRFGVEQRKALLAKAGHMPHVLSLTATPIPRSLALTLYGELDVSILDTKPVGRPPIITQIVSPNSRTQLYAKIEMELKKGRQAFVVCPTITDNPDKTLRSVEAVFKELSQTVFKSYRVGLLHGKLKAIEKNSLMEQFVKHELDILVSTTVIEVGVDVPNATVMLIESAERFGLAQAHQLRGRVGRSEHQGYCFLVMSTSAAPTKRLRVIETSDDGFRLAELDLELRGPGAIYGELQHGQLDLRIAKLSDQNLVSAARRAAKAFIERKENLLDYKELNSQTAKLRAVTNLN
ncbi:MAG TPA: ATP-dependent DNA helicase RecG [Candidatus Binatia bacterium]|nr:ATP-dependent DNA helicase RecG [Candidatus Binatia bacterium]